MMQNKATQQEEKTLVLWDINGCPIPDGYDPRLVGRRIESALKNSGYSRPGPLTITAVGDLRNTPGENVLRELSSTGIALEHCHDFQAALFARTVGNKYPATLMLIGGPQLAIVACTLDVERKWGYTILLAYPDLDSLHMRCVPEEWLHVPCVSKGLIWESLLEEGEMDSGSADNKQQTTRLVLPDESPWYCRVCFFAAQSSEDLTKHLKSVKHAYMEWDLVASHNNVNRFEFKPQPPNDDPGTIKEWDLLYKADIELRMNISTLEREEKEEEEEKTLLLWDINGCPIPDGFDPRLVRPTIESALKNYGPLTITAIGDLRQTPGGYKVLRELSSTGIALKHSHDAEADLLVLAYDHSCPAPIMLISGPSQLQCLSLSLNILHDEGNRFLLAYPLRDPSPDCPWKDFEHFVIEESLWKSLLEGEMDSGSADKTTRLVLQDKCSETGETPLSCSVCGFAGQSFKDFTRHLNMHIMKTSRRPRLKKKKKLMKKKRTMKRGFIREERLKNELF